MDRIIFSFAFLIMAFVIQAQDFNAAQAFAQDFYPHGGNQYRSADGSPGPLYWQNKADYNIDVRFDENTNVLSGTVDIDYYNNSPDTLRFLWLALDHNTERNDAVGKAMYAPSEEVNLKDGMQIESLSVLDGNRWTTAEYIVKDTRMRIWLNEPLAGGGNLQKVRIKYSFELKEIAAGYRAGILETEHGKVYNMAYWYPRLCVYDDIRGWNTMPYIGGGEFYCEYGDFNYNISLPAGMLAVGSGELANSSEVLSDALLSRVQEARKADETYMIRTLEDVREGISPTRVESGLVTWRFQMQNTRDVAFAFSRAYIWEGMRAVIPGGRSVFVQSVYPEESLEMEDGWPRATEYLKFNIEHFSEKWFPFPYPEAINVASGIGGMEFPALTFNTYKPKDGYLMWLLVSHEMGHTWFPMIVGSNERRYPFMDEGFNTFIDIYAQEEYNNGEYAPKRDGEYAPGGGHPNDEIIPVIRELQNSHTLLHAPDLMDYKHVHPMAYFKAAHGLVLLREFILGPEEFDRAFREYIRRWAYKHPDPIDFFRTMDNVTGEDLTWFWRGWYAENWLLDQAVTKVEYVDDDPKKGSLITIENKGQLVMPVPLKIQEVNGVVHKLRLPVQVWSRDGVWRFQAPTSSTIFRVHIDPDRELPDSNRNNNMYPVLE